MTKPSEKRTNKWREDIYEFRKKHGLSKRVLLNCCLVKRLLAWATPPMKGIIHIFVMFQFYNDCLQHVALEIVLCDIL